MLNGTTPYRPRVKARLMKSSVTNRLPFGTMTMSESRSQISSGGQGLRPCSAPQSWSWVAINLQQASRRKTTMRFRSAPLFQLPAIAIAWMAVVGPSNSKRPAS